MGRLAKLERRKQAEIPIVVLLHGMTAGEFQSKPEVPVFLKKRNLLDLNSIDTYFAELRRRVQGS